MNKKTFSAHEAALFKDYTPPPRTDVVALELSAEERLILIDGLMAKIGIIRHTYEELYLSGAFHPLRPEPNSPLPQLAAIIREASDLRDRLFASLPAHMRPQPTEEPK